MFLYFAWKYHPNTRFSLYWDMFIFQYKVISSNTRWHYVAMPGHYFSPVIVILFFSGVLQKHNLCISSPFNLIAASVNCRLIGKERARSGCWMQNDVIYSNSWRICCCIVFAYYFWTVLCLASVIALLHCKNLSWPFNLLRLIVKGWWIAMKVKLGARKIRYYCRTLYCIRFLLKQQNKIEHL